MSKYDETGPDVGNVMFGAKKEVISSFDEVVGARLDLRRRSLISWTRLLLASVTSEGLKAAKALRRRAEARIWLQRPFIGLIHSQSVEIDLDGA